MKTSAANSTALLDWMGSLADPTRLRLLRVLERNELGVVELCDILQLPQSTVSRHLKVLDDSNWLVSRGHGSANFYRMILDELEPAARRLWLLAREQTENWSTVSQDALRLERRLRERQSDPQSFFAGAARSWQKMRTELYGQSYISEAILALVPPQLVVADLGCGTGDLTAMLAQHVQKVIGVDNSSAMLKAARRQTVGLANVDLRKGALEALPVESGSCDAALLLLALTYVEDAQQVLNDTSRILRPGGRLILVDLLKHDRDDFRRQMGQRHMGFDRTSLIDMISRAGFHGAHARPLAPQAGSKGPALLLAGGCVESKEGT